MSSLLLLFGSRPQPNAMLAAMLKPRRVVATRHDMRDVWPEL